MASGTPSFRLSMHSQAAGRFFHVKAQRREHARQHLALHRLVVHHQQRPALAEEAGDLVRRVGLRAGVVDLAQVQPHAEGAALVRARFAA
jgi:hypothetical protein